jgi:two-component system chemotaxis response regulator CheB
MNKEDYCAQRLRVLIAENSPGTRQNLSELCASLPHLEVVGEAGNGLDAIEAVRILKPDVLTLDMNMPRISGFDVLRMMLHEKRRCVVIVLTSLADEFYRKKCRELKATHFFNKITEFEQFLELMKSM